MEKHLALVTGASSGIGEAIAEKLAQRGYRLVLVGRRKERLEALCKSLESHTACLPLQCDLFDPDGIDTAMQSLPEEFRQVDVLVNCAGNALGIDPAQQAKWQDWQDMISVNCTALAKLTHYFLPGMVERNRGDVINIGSVAATYPYKGNNVYGASKAFVAVLTQNLKADLLGTAVRVSNIEPAMVSDTEFTSVRLKGDEERTAAVKKGIVALQAADIANTVEWILQQPPHVNINRVEIMPVAQAPSRLDYHRVDEY